MDTEYIKLATATVVFLATIFGFLKQNSNNNKKLQKSISEFKTKLDFVYEIHKDRPKLSIIIRKLEDIIDTLTENKNKEVNRILLNSLEKIKPVFEDIFESNFQEVQKEKVIKIFLRKASSMRTNLDFTLLFGKNYNDKLETNFINAIKNEIIPDISLFANSLEEISKEKTNGERITAFENIAKLLVTNISTKTIKVYTELV